MAMSYAHTFSLLAKKADQFIVFRSKLLMLMMLLEGQFRSLHKVTLKIN